MLIFWSFLIIFAPFFTFYDGIIVCFDFLDIFGSVLYIEMAYRLVNSPFDHFFKFPFSKPPEIGAEGPDFGWSATSEASHGTPEGGLFKKTAKWSSWTRYSTYTPLADDQVVRQSYSIHIFCTNLGLICCNSCSIFGFEKNIYLGPPF